MVVALVTVFIIGYFFIAMEHPFKINKTATALALGTLLWTVFVFCNGIAQPGICHRGYDGIRVRVAVTAYISGLLHGCIPP